MQDVTITLRFLTPSLGERRGPDIDRFVRNANGEVIFMSTYWQSLLRFGAKRLGQAEGLVKDVHFSLPVSGTVGTYDRYWRKQQFTRHEAFVAGSTLVAHAVLPDGLSAETLSDILKEASRYRGLSPYGWRAGWGSFEVVSVK